MVGHIQTRRSVKFHVDNTSYSVLSRHKQSKPVFSRIPCWIFHFLMARFRLILASYSENPKTVSNLKSYSRDICYSLHLFHSWNWLLGYNVFVIIVKTILQIPGCIFINDISECWLLRLLGIGCIKKFGGSALIAGLAVSDQCPPVPREDIGLAWDGLCFGFLIMQRRIFNSFNFFHIIDEAKATTILASRGADLIEELREKQMSQKGEQERRILEKIKLKMDKIKANQQKIQGPSFKDPTSHFVGKLAKYLM